jgi:ABC-type lipoprotein export system ATPase subunit/aminoglycoside phosphotransferase (APT) family kinase protein
MTQNIDNEHIERIAVREFGRPPDSVQRMTTGICNEVYSVAIGDREYIFRLKPETRYMYGSHNHIPLFRSKGIRVPEILAEDYTKSWLPVAFQIQSKLPGTDIAEVIHTLNDEQLTAIGGEVANVFRQLAPVPNNGKFGVLWGDDKDLVDSWSSEVERVIRVVKGWGNKTGVLDKTLEMVLDRVFSENKEYFNRIRPYTYYGDIAGKNVMVHEGRFAGLVDLDALAQGDPLEAIGRIKASWYGTHHGEVYSKAVMDALGLPEPQRRIVTMYALLNRIFWTLENGVQFNRNTDTQVDREREAKDKLAVSQLYTELYGEPLVPVPAKQPEVVQPGAERIEAVQVEDRVPVEMEEIPVVAVSEPSPRTDVVTADDIPAVVETAIEKPRPVRRRKTVAEPIIEPPTPEPAAESEVPTPALEIAAENIPPIDEPKEEFIKPVNEITVPPPAVISPTHVEVVRPRPDASISRAVLEASGISKTYVSDGIGFNALSNVDLRIQKGDCLAIVGKSGSGKSTLMHLLACLDAPTEGYVYVDGDDTSTMSEAEKNQLRNEKFGFVFQQFFLNGRDTVFENVVLPMRIRGASEFEMGEAAEAALSAVGLSDKSDKKAKDLSGGEKQRVCIARALVGNPQVIFADEPTGNLDSNTGEAVEKMLFDLNRDKGITLVIVTHDGDLARRCERIIEMKDGHIISERRGEDFRR